MGIDFGKMLSDVGKGVSDFFVKAGDDIVKAGDDIVKTFDQNGDGKLDLSDIQTVIDRNQAAQAENQWKMDLERLKPLFPEDFEQSAFTMPKILCIAEIDKPHAESAACRGSVGFRTVLEDLSAVTIYRDRIDGFGLSFYPELDHGVYYADPCDGRRYVLMDTFFAYLKMQRVAELQRIAQSLGAKHFKVTYKEKNRSSSSLSVNASVSAKGPGAGGGAEVQHTASNSSASAVRVEAEMDFPGHAPVKPDLYYLKKEINIANLIEMRMNSLSPLQYQHFIIEMSNSSGIRLKDAVKIDALMKTMRASGSLSVAREVQNEARRILEYEITF